MQKMIMKSFGLSLQDSAKANKKWKKKKKPMTTDACENWSLKLFYTNTADT